MQKFGFSSFCTLCTKYAWILPSKWKYSTNETYFSHQRIYCKYHIKLYMQPKCLPLHTQNLLHLILRFQWKWSVLPFRKNENYCGERGGRQNNRFVNRLIRWHHYFIIFSKALESHLVERAVALHRVSKWNGRC